MKKHLLCFLALFTAVSGFAADGGFLFVHFKGETSPMGEQIYFGLSPDTQTWETLNKGEPVLVSDVGRKGVRDPFLLRSPNGQKFFLLATDLSVYGIKRDFAKASREGSRSIVIWESTDLVNWSAPRLAEVAAEDAGCAWAPEAVYDEATHTYLVYWSSKNKSDGFGKQRIWATHTNDFKTFEKPFVFFDLPQGITETTIVREFGTYYRFSTLEKDGTISMETSNNVSGDWHEVADFSLKNQRVNGATPFVLKQSAGGALPTWGLFVDANRGYQGYVTEDLGSGIFKGSLTFFGDRFHAGSILPVTAEEYARLKKAFP